MTNQNTPAVLQKDITDTVNHKVAAMQQEGLALPQNYSPANALKSAFFAMSNAAGGNLLEKCTKESIANSLLDMVVQGLSPAKTQCYFVPYGNQLKMTRSYFGTQAVLKRLRDVKDVWANIIYEGDQFDVEIIDGRETLKEHKTSFLNRDNPIIGAYCIIERSDGTKILTTMTKKEIDASWSQAKTKNVQNKFPQEMAKRTVLNRAAKAFVNTSDDSDLLIDAINNTTANEFQSESDRKEAEIIEEIDQNANTEILDPEPIERPANISADGEIQEGQYVDDQAAQTRFDLGEEDPY
ncbi:recombination protein RecT [Enterococcus casseliflavus]|uniref:recombinase RecT n=1 Tax=Enterococcus casseliflavus TaxID=37734 RepID=UPI0008EB937E|nr:RecT family recombinase [Enterococcus casseliflavus]SFD57367.1 recombination protein RecT [Enterococcus casseliflavus]